MANMEVKDSLFQLPINVTENGTITKTLETQDTYLDKNIKIEVNTPDATFEKKDKGEGANGEITATVSTTDTVYTSDSETPYAIEIKADAHVNPITVGTATAGFTAATDEVTLDAGDATTNSKTLYIKAGTLSGTGSSGAEGNIELTKVNAQPESGFYIKASGSGEVGIATAGWVDPEHTTSVKTDGDTFYTVKSAVLSNSEANADEFVESSAPVLTEDGYLFIEKGYIDNTKISLATLVPDDANITSENADKVYNTVKAYDKDGKLIVGTMGDAELGEITANDAEATVATVTVAANGEAFQVSGTGEISGSTSVAISKRGLAETSLNAAGVISGTAKVDASLAKIGLAVETSGNDGVVTPVISKEDATTVKTGAITTVAPTSGHYVAVSTAAIKEDVTVSAKVATEGYGTVDAFSKTDGTISAGADASGTYYVPVNEGSHTIVESASDVVKAGAVVSTEVAASDDRAIGGVLNAAPATGAYLTIDGSAATTAGSVKTSSTCTVEEGYVTAESKTTTITEVVEVTPTAAATKYIKIYEGAILDA